MIKNNDLRQLVEFLRNLETYDSEKIVLKGRIPSKKNSKSLGVKKGEDGKLNPFIKSSPQHQKWVELQTTYLLQKYKHLIKKSFKNIAFIWVRFGFGDLRGTDLTNKAESVMDLLCHKDIKIIDDDNYFVMDKVFLEGQYIGEDNFIADIYIYYKKDNQVLHKPEKISKKESKEEFENPGRNKNGPRFENYSLD